MGREGLIEAINEQHWIDQVAEGVQPVVREALQSTGPIKDALHGTWLGHPLHPVVTDIPVGAWTASMVFDALGMAGVDDLEGASDGLIAIGLVGAVASAVTGTADWSETDGRARKIGVVHGVLNLAAAALYTTSLAMRRGKSRERGIGLSMLGYAIASFSAYLGGHLVFGEQIGVDHTSTADAGKPDTWTAVANDDEIRENEPKRVMAGSIAILLVRQNGTIGAITETCPHMGGPLAEGKLEGDTIRCPWHGSRFCVRDGELREGPSAFPARPYDVRVRDGRVEIRARR